MEEEKDQATADDFKATEEAKDLKDLKDSKDPKDSKDFKDLKDLKDFKDLKDSKDFKDLKPVAKPPLVEGLKAYFCNPSALLATSGFIAIVFVNNAYLFWAPKFVAQKFAAELGDSAVAAAGNGTMLYHHVCAFAAIMLGGFLTDAFVKRWPRFRLLFQSCALFLGAPALVFVAYAPSVAATWIAVAIYGVFRGFFEVNTHASLFDVVAPQHRSTAVGLLNMIAFFFGRSAFT